MSFPHIIVSPKTCDALRPNQDMSWLGYTCQTCGEIGHWPTGGEGPSAFVQPFKPRHTDQCQARV